MVKKRKARRSGAGVVRLAWARLVEGLRRTGWVVVQPRPLEVYYQTGQRTGTISIHYRGNGLWRFVVDSTVRKRSRLEMVDATRPKSYRGPCAMHEITLVSAEAEPVTEWLLRWVVAYDGGAALPAMPDGTPYPGGYIWTQARWEAYHERGT